MIRYCNCETTPNEFPRTLSNTLIALLLPFLLLDDRGTSHDRPIERILFQREADQEPNEDERGAYDPWIGECSCVDMNYSL